MFSSSFPPAHSLSSLPRFLLLLFVTVLTFHDLASASGSTKIGNGYRLLSIEESSNGGLIGLLQVKQKNNVYGKDIPLLQLSIKHETESRLRVHITDARKKRWEVPYNLLPREKPPQLGQTIGRPRKDAYALNAAEYVGTELIFAYTADPFTFAVKRKSNGEILFDSSYNTLVFKDQYLEISTKLPKSASLYGLGENSQPHGIKLYPNDPYTLYSTDISAINLNADLYGSHPVYMDLRNVDGEANAHAVLLLNSNGMDVFYRGDSLTYKVIGGVFDFYFFSGSTPLAVVDQYTAFVGRPAAMPYWAFGFHQCRWGYHNLSVVEDVVENYKKAKIPLDVIWNDDDHMDGHKDFTLNPHNYPRPKLLEFLDKIHQRGMKYIVIIDPGIGVNSSYGVYQRALANDVFIKYHSKPFLAQVWPGAVNFPDFLNPTTVQWWGDEVRRFHELVPVDGLWIDMNEVSNFCNGLCTLPEGRICPNGTGPGWDCCLDCKNITKTKWDDPPYKINASGIQAPIGYKTIATSAVHYNGVLEYDAHSLYGFSQSIATHKALQGLEGKRPFILTRSTYVGSGHYAAHWTGDNKGTWEDLKISISTMLNFGIFGVPMVGSDICGFYPAPTEELCNRWIELGAFYPFSRDHANFYSPRQELYQWESVAESARNALGMRYKLLPHLYTLNYESHTTGAPIARPLFFTFTNETTLYGLSTQFLLGSSLMVSPVLDPNKTTVEAIFPPGSWYDMFDLTNVILSKESHPVVLNAPLHAINVHLYQNSIIPMQQGGLISKEARTTPFTLIVAFPLGATSGKCTGKLFLDDDELPEMKLAAGTSTYVEFYAKLSGNGAVKLWSDVTESKFAVEKGWVIEKVAVLGLQGSSSAVEIEVDGIAVAEGLKTEVSTAEHRYTEAEAGEGGGKGKNVMVEIKGLELPKYVEQLAGNLTAMLPRLSSLADILPKETLLWKLKLLKTAAAYATSRLHAIKAQVLVLASGKDNMLRSRDEAWRLLKSIQNCNIRYFKDNGHTILLEDGVNLLTIIKGTSMYRRSRNHDFVMDFIPPSMSEFEQAIKGNEFFRNYAGPVFFSTTEDGKIVRGLAGVPDEGPVLFVGYHMLIGLELPPLVEQFLREKKILVRGVAHPALFSVHADSEDKEFSFFNTLRLYGALPVSPSNLFKLLKTKSHVLLYPGGAREALHKKGEEYKLFWPDEPEFIRMAARFGATIVPFGVIGEDDIAELVLDYDDLMKIPYVSNQLRSNNQKYEEFNVRAGRSGEVANQALYIPGLLPKIPGRVYYLFGKPIEMQGRQDMLKDREKARELYLEIKSEVETSMSYLLKKREDDPYRGIVDRMVYRAFRAPVDQVPSFEP